MALALFGARAMAQQSSGWPVCNETSYVLETATARPDGRAILVQGWTRLRPGECRVAIPAPLARGTHYLYARTSSAHRGGRQQWGGDAPLCVDPAHSFSIENPPECADMGLEERLFRRVRINKRDSWRTTFSEAQPYTLARARQPGFSASSMTRATTSTPTPAASIRAASPKRSRNSALPRDLRRTPAKTNLSTRSKSPRATAPNRLG